MLSQGSNSKLRESMEALWKEKHWRRSLKVAGIPAVRLGAIPGGMRAWGRQTPGCKAHRGSVA